MQWLGSIFHEAVSGKLVVAQLSVTLSIVQRVSQNLPPVGLKALPQAVSASRQAMDSFRVMGY